MKGYKALSMDMKAIHGNDMQYELGKTYFVRGDILPCKNGFHFCDKIENLNIYYDISKSRIFEVEADGDIVQKDEKYAAERIKLIRELTPKEINDYFKQNWESIITNKDKDVRIAVAKQGYGLDVLVNDKDGDVRIAVAKQGYGLDVLVRDTSWKVRCAVAEQGYGLDVLVRDTSWKVRIAVAEQGYGLNVLIRDEDADVRRVARAEFIVKFVRIMRGDKKLRVIKH